ncbi:MAG: hypothetical protein WCV62_03635 [Candidatus Peribacteraceae bacterium]
MAEVLSGQESAERGTEAFRRGVEILRSAEEFLFRSRAQSTGGERALADMCPIPVYFALSLTDIADALSDIAPLYEEAGLSEQANRAAKYIEEMNPSHRIFGPYFKQYDFMRIAADGIKKARRGKTEQLPLPYRSLRKDKYKVCDSSSPEMEGQIVNAIKGGQTEEAIRIASEREWPDLLRFTHQHIALHLAKNRRFEEAIIAALPLKKEREQWYEETLLELIRQAVTGKDPQKYQAAEQIIQVLEDLIPESLENGRYCLPRYASQHRDDAIWHLTRAKSEEQQTEEAKMWARKITASGHRAVTLAEVSAGELLQKKAYEPTLAEALQVTDDSGLAKEEPLSYAIAKAGIARSMIRAGKLYVAQPLKLDQNKIDRSTIDAVLNPVREALLRTLPSEGEIQ